MQRVSCRAASRCHCVDRFIRGQLQVRQVLREVSTAGPVLSAVRQMPLDPADVVVPDTMLSKVAILCDPSLMYVDHDSRRVQAVSTSTMYENPPPKTARPSSAPLRDWQQLTATRDLNHLRNFNDRPTSSRSHPHGCSQHCSPSFLLHPARCHRTLLNAALASALKTVPAPGVEHERPHRRVLA